MKGQHWKKSKNLLKAACLSAALATAWGAGNPPPATADDTYTMKGSITHTLTQDLTDFTMLYYYVNASPDTVFSTQNLGGFSKSSNSVNFTTVLPTNAEFGANYTIVGVYNGNRVEVGMNLASYTSADGKTWNQYFGSSVSESDLAKWILDPITYKSDLQSFFDNYGVGGLGFAQVMVASYEGTTTPYPTVTLGDLYLFPVSQSVPVPLPPTLLLMVPSLGVAYLLRRKKESD